ncbi:MAG: hypothetical protein O2960_01305 [Verrucomicrobia bacterium]|nr:hypothetical protein [Verrucomicrobiota bacterium]
MKLQIYQVLHVASMVLLTAFIFQTFANPDPKNRRKTGMITGILALLMLIGGFGLVATMKVGFPWWVIVKLVCWLGLASISGMAYRKPQRIPLLTIVAIALILIAIITVYFRHVTAGSYE